MKWVSLPVPHWIFLSNPPFLVYVHASPTHNVKGQKDSTETFPQLFIILNHDWPLLPFKNEGKIILVFYDFTLHKKMQLLHVMYFELKKLSHN